MVFGAVFCFRKIFGEILQKIGEISSQPSGNTGSLPREEEARTVSSIFIVLLNFELQSGIT